MRKTFDAELQELNYEMIDMAAAAEDAIDVVTQSLTAGDGESARSAVEMTKHMDQMERDIENRCLRLLLQQQPVARDLRTISAALKMVTDLQRIGDQCANIAEIALLLKAQKQTRTLADIRTMSQKSGVMVKRSIFAYVNRDTEAANAVVALDDVVGLIEYSIAISLALAVSTGSSGLGAASVLKPIAVNVGVLVLGGCFGVFLKLLMPQKRSKDNRLIISVSLLFAFCGICAMVDVSPLLGCMSMGTVYINVSDDDKLFKQLNYFTPPILLLFFVQSGLSFQLDALVNTSAAVGTTPLLVVGVVYFFVRILGKYAGAFLGCLVTKKTKEVRNYLGLALIPQAGVAIGLAALGARTIGGETGIALETVILASSVLYELIGPACAKLSLYLSKSYSTKLEDIVPAQEVDEQGRQKTAVELLIQRIQAIQEELPRRSAVSDEEQAFLEAAEDQIAALSSIHAGVARKRRA